MRSTILALILAILAAPFAPSRELSAAAPQPGRPRVGLALSGGGAKGLAHIGALKVIEEAGIPVDVVAGTSMGSIVGALYAIGYTPAEIERIFLEADWSDLLSDRLERGELPMKNRKKDDRYLFSFPVVQGRVKLPAGLISGQRIYNLFVRLAWPVLEVSDFRKFPRPFACVATDIAGGAAVTLDHGYLPDALRASMSIPSIFIPVRLGSKVLVDGGIMRNLPAEDARNLGADIVIGVDVGDRLLPADKLRSLAEIMNQAQEVTGESDHRKQLALCNVVIAPSLDEFRTFDYGRAREIIDRGEAAARAHMGELRALADSIRALEGTPSPGDTTRAAGTGALLARAAAAPAVRDSAGILVGAPGCAVGPMLGLGSVTCGPVQITDVEIRGLHDVSSRVVLAELGIRPPAIVTVDELERAVERVYSGGFFTDISYRFEETPQGRKLVVIVRENSGILLNTGLRYDTQWGPSLLLNATARNIFGHASQFEFDLLLGDRKEFTGEYALHTGIEHSVGIRADVHSIDDHIDEYYLGERVSRWRTQSTRAGFLLETLLSRVFYAAGGVNMEWYRTSPDVAPADMSAGTGRIAFASGDLWFDTLDRSWFPRRGCLLRIRGEAAGEALGGDATFNRAHAAWQFAIPIHRRVTLGGDAFFGATAHGRAPKHYDFFIGGIDSYNAFQGTRTSSFYGYNHQELSGPNAFAAGLDLQIEPVNRWYLVASVNAGSAEDERRNLFEREALHAGGALTVGTETPAGPAALSLSYSKHNKLGWFLSVGFPF